MPTDAGQLTHRVLIERRAVARDAFGAAEGTWTSIGRRWTWPRFGTGQERREAAQSSASLAATFRMRACSLTRSLGPADRLRCDPLRPVPSDLEAATAWDIRSVVPAEPGYVDVAAVAAVR